MGIGLPARRLFTEANTEEHAKKLETALRTEHGPGGRPLTYDEVLKLGAGPNSQAPGNFHWLWRSGLRDYQAQAVVWQAWLGRVLRHWQELRLGQQTWLNGFSVYDSIEPPPAGAVVPAEPAYASLPSFREFPGWCAELVAELEQVSAETSSVTLA